MKKIVWSDKLSLGVPQIDEQHKRLVHLVNNMVAAIQNDVAEEVLEGIFKELREYTVFHFADEERYMEEIGFPERGAHANMHRDLKGQVKQYQRDLYEKVEVTPSKVIEFMRSWLVDHIIYKDMEISNYIKKQKEIKPVTIGGGSPSQE